MRNIGLMARLWGSRSRLGWIGSITAAILIFDAAALAADAAPAGRVVIAWHVTISPAWFDPSAAPPQITPFGMLYAIHDALVRPYPGQKMGGASLSRGRRARTA
jgi:hypothetical protein